MFRTPQCKTLKIALRVAVAATSLGSISSAYAGEGEGTNVNTFFTTLPAVVAQAGQVNGTYATSSRTWQLAPSQSGGGPNG